MAARSTTPIEWAAMLVLPPSLGTNANTSAIKATLPLGITCVRALISAVRCTSTTPFLGVCAIDSANQIWNAVEIQFLFGGSALLLTEAMDNVWKLDASPKTMLY
mmetsp:Transcript_55590/g.99006  ORF Transcript_55590/g.99006 Transcript_55590/m.99006 type:complete len:105 (+) Transcript_55590:220-534(+)